jgi:hypothetical protein
MFLDRSFYQSVCPGSASLRFIAIDVLISKRCFSPNLAFGFYFVSRD